jgi:hypothetical protein
MWNLLPYILHIVLIKQHSFCSAVSQGKTQQVKHAMSETKQSIHDKETPTISSSEDSMQ